mmetsp:Transcript_3124/g.4447  ORF Transcript_3124/g.4447 Transcript_3124/m.4447 type:complete len:91 (-) Transcript_3124:171-443(-)
MGAGVAEGDVDGKWGGREVREGGVGCVGVECVGTGFVDLRGWYVRCAAFSERSIPRSNEKQSTLPRSAELRISCILTDVPLGPFKSAEIS